MEQQLLNWRCRRGMLELDLLLIPFFEQQYVGLSPKLQKDFERLLEESDQSLWRWFFDAEPCPTEFSDIVTLIRHDHAL